MNKYMKITINIICILIIVVCIMGLFSSIKGNYNDNITFTDKCVSISNANKLLVYDKKIYIGDGSKGIVQIFDMSGNYLYGIYVPTNGGDFWMGISDNKLYLYSIRKNTMYEISYNKNVVYYKIQPDSFDAFCKTLSSNLTHNAKFTTGRTVLIENINTGVKEYININAPLWPFAVGFYFLGLFASSIVLFIINNLIEKIFNISKY